MNKISIKYALRGIMVGLVLAFITSLTIIGGNIWYVTLYKPFLWLLYLTPFAMSVGQASGMAVAIILPIFLFLSLPIYGFIIGYLYSSLFRKKSDQPPETSPELSPVDIKLVDTGSVVLGFFISLTLFIFLVWISDIILISMLNSIRSFYYPTFTIDSPIFYHAIPSGVFLYLNWILAKKQKSQLTKKGVVVGYYLPIIHLINWGLYFFIGTELPWFNISFWM